MEFNKELFLSLCKKYKVRLDTKITEPMIKEENEKFHSITIKDIKYIFTQRE